MRGVTYRCFKICNKGVDSCAQFLKSCPGYIVWYISLWETINPTNRAYIKPIQEFHYTSILFYDAYDMISGPSAISPPIGGLNQTVTALAWGTLRTYIIMSYHWLFTVFRSEWNETWMDQGQIRQHRIGKGHQDSSHAENSISKLPQLLRFWTFWYN